MPGELIPGLGTSVSRQGGRPGRNLKTGETVIITERRARHVPHPVAWERLRRVTTNLTFKYGGD